jgi:hypothetical protein
MTMSNSSPVGVSVARELLMGSQTNGGFPVTISVMAETANPDGKQNETTSHVFCLGASKMTSGGWAP